jgi:hypothetical protein
MVDALARLLERPRQLQRAGPVVLQQVKSHARRRLLAHTRQPAQGLQEGLQRRSLSHGQVQRRR